MNTDYTQSIENLFNAIDVIVSKKIEDVSYDNTIICTVVDDTDRKNGVYQVTNGATKFEAYSDSSDYRTDDSVRVQIIQGDYSGKKYIVGRAVTDTDTTPLTYVSPLDTIVNITGNLVDNKGASAGLIANGEVTSIDLWSADVSDKEIWTDGIYSALTVRADFRSLLDNYDLRGGSYGLRVDLYIKPSKESTTIVNNYFELDSSEMFGNPYAFSVFTKQAKKVNLTMTGIVKAVALSAYQKADFINRSGKAIGAAQQANILIKNIEIGFGSDLTAIDDNTVKIYTNSSPTYKYNNHTESTNEKSIGLVWYNKNDNNEYLGFSDGIYDPKYDELEYIAAAAEDARLAAYLGREGVPGDPESLELAANIDDALPIFKAARKLITSDLISQLRSYEKQLDTKAASLLDEYTSTTVGNDNKLVAAANDIAKLEESLKAMYANILAYWYQKSEGESPSEDIDISDYATSILEGFDSIQKDINTLLANVRDTASSGYAGVCDNYEARIARVFTSINKKLDTLPSGISDGSDYTILENYKAKTNFKSYERKDFSDYENKYCIYWYRAVKDAEADDIMPSGWERMTDYDRFGIPGKGEEVDGKVRNDKMLDAGDNTFDYYMQYDLAEEKFVAVVFYNHEQFVSNELVFTNEDDIPDKLTLDKSDALVISHETNSRDNYNCYAMTNYLLNAAESSVDRVVTCHYDGLLAGDEALVNARVYWYVPAESTMIDIKDTLLAKNGFIVDETREKNGYTCYYKTITATKQEDETYSFVDDKEIDSRSFWYRIKPYYEQSATLNDIQCEVILANNNDEDYIAGQLTLTFGQQGTSGTKYTMVIAPATAQRGTTASDDYTMSLHLEDAEGELVPMSTDSLPSSASNMAYELEVSSIMSRLVTGSSYAEKDSSAPACSGEDGKEYWTLTASKGNFGIYKANAVIGIGKESKDEDGNTVIIPTRYVNLTSWFSVPWSGDKGYYLSGPTSIVYNNLGTLDNTSAYQTPYKLFNENNEQVNVTWSLDYCPINGESWDEDAIDLRYMPTLNADNTLSPASMYLSDLEYYPVLVAKSGEDTLWRQPIIIMQNQYASTMLNEWDGSFQIDEENGTIMSSMIAAGRKTKDNTFEGVVMGCVAQDLEIDELQDDVDFNGTGLYGFQDGAASFGLLTDGRAFMGRAGHGRILFDGSGGTIASASYTQTKYTETEDGKLYENPAGMLIDLDDARLVMRSASLGSEGKWVGASIGDTDDELTSGESNYSATITMDANVENDSYLDITVPWHNGSKWVQKPLIHIGDEVDDNKIKHSYYLQSQNYVGSTYNWKDAQKPSEDGDGSCLDLVEGSINVFNLLLQSKNVLLNSSMEDDLPYFVIKSNDGNNLIQCGGSDSYIYGKSGSHFYLKSDTYDPEGEGMFLDIENGSIISYDFKLDSEYITIDSGSNDGYGLIEIGGKDNSNNTITITNDPSKTPLKVGNNFSVSWAGHLEATDATIKGNITATTLTATSSGTIGKWKITSDGNLQSNNGLVVLNGTSGAISGSSISGGSISGTSISGSSIEAGTAFSVTSSGSLKATDAILTTLTVNKSLTVAKDGGAGALSVAGSSTLTGSVTIGTEKNNADLKVNGTTSISGNTTISGSLTIDASKHYLYLSSSGASGAYINALGGNQCSINASTGIWLKAPYIAIGSSVAYTDYQLTLPIPSEIYLSGEAQTLEQYVESQSGIITINSTSKVSQMARKLVDASAKTTLAAPASVGTSGQFLKTTDSAGTTSWSDLPIASSTDYGVVKLGYTTSGKNYAVQASNGKLYVNVPWTSGSSYTAGSGITISSGEISLNTTYISNYVTARYINAGSNSSKASIAVIENTGTTTVRYTGTTISSITGGSSKRFKHDIKDGFDSSILYDLKPVSYYYNSDMYWGDNKRYGFIAEDVLKIDPELVEMEKDDPTKCNSLYYNSILTLAVAEIQKLRKELDEIKSRLQ